MCSLLLYCDNRVIETTITGRPTQLTVSIEAEESCT